MPQLIMIVIFMPIRKVFLDTSYLLALELANDQNHQAAQAHWQQVITNTNTFVTTSYILDEAVTYFNSRNYHAKAVQVGSYLLISPSVQLIHVDESLFYLGWTYFQQHKDKQYSLTDSISFIIMQQYGIQVALTFDQHFVQAGFQKSRDNKVIAYVPVFSIGRKGSNSEGSDGDPDVRGWEGIPASPSDRLRIQLVAQLHHISHTGLQEKRYNLAIQSQTAIIMNTQLVQSIRQMILALTPEEQAWLKVELSKETIHSSAQLPDLNSFSNTIQLKQDPLEFQHQIRNEWA